ncbi:MAG: TIGR02466 family protein [Rhodospirillaceae bacterium]
MMNQNRTSGATPAQGCTPAELSNLFPTVLLRRQMPDAPRRNARLREIVLEHEKTDPGVRHSNVGGWHSSADLWDWPEPEMQELCGFVKQAARDLTATVAPIRPGDEIRVIPYGGAWANVLREGGYNKVHNHPGAVWSAVYYVADGEPYDNLPGTGLFEFMDPRPGNIHGGKEVIRPDAGLLMMFPSWLYHYVNPHHGKRERISIAFNMTVEIKRDLPKP